MNPFLLALAFAAGVAIAAQAAINGQLAANLGGYPIVAAFVSFALGTLVLGVLAVSAGGFGAALPQFGNQPLWRLTGGLLGAGAIFCTVLLAPRLGLATLLALVIAGQLVSAITIDHFGLLGVATRTATPARFIGAAITICGVLFALFGDRLLRLSNVA